MKSASGRAAKSRKGGRRRQESAPDTTSLNAGAAESLLRAQQIPRDRTAANVPLVRSMQQTFGNQRVQQALRPGQGRVRSPARPATEGAGAIYRHVSYEHRLLGDTKPGRIEEMVSGRVDEATRRHVLEEELDRLSIWRRDPKSVTRSKVESTWPDVRTLRLKGSNLLLTYGELNTLPDYFPNPEAIDTAPEDVVLPILQMVRQQGYNRIVDLLGKTVEIPMGFGPPVRVPAYANFEGAVGPLGTGTMADIKEVKTLNKLTADLGGGVDRYQALVSRNACHFAPFSWERWQHFHDKARKFAESAHSETDAEKQAEFERQAWLNNGYADHFLQDSFAAGHLINKTLIMQWFVEWLKERDISLHNFERIAEMTEAAQPLLAGRDLYRGVMSSTDPQTAEEEGGDAGGRALAAGLKPSGGDPLEESYRNYLAFLNSAAVQSAAGDLHNYFNDEKRGMWVTSPAKPDGFKVYGDASLLQGGEGVRIAAETAQLSQQAIGDLIEKGSGVDTGEIRKNFPNGVQMVVTDPKTKAAKLWSGPLEKWHDEILKDLCLETIFPDVHYHLLDLFFTHEMGRVSTDAPTGPERRDLRRSSNELIGRHSGVWGLDEAGLARDLRGLSSTQVLSVLDELPWEDRDDVSFEFAQASSIDELAELDKAVINRMIDEMVGGWTTDEEEEQIVRLRRAKEAKAARARPEPLPAIGGPPPTSIPA